MLRNKEGIDPVANEVKSLYEHARKFDTEQSNIHYISMMREMMGERINRYIPEKKRRAGGFIKVFRFSNR